MSPLIEAHELTKHYRVGTGLFSRHKTLKAVDGVSFTLEAGRTLALVGESGCGKSTTARLLLGMSELTGGSVRFNGEPVAARQDHKWRSQRRHMQLVQQDTLGSLDPRVTVGRQVAEPLVIHGLVRGQADRRDRVRELFAAVGLGTDLYERYPHELSGGQRQRIVLARALIVEPRLIVCDEPVSALDVSVQAQVLNLLQDLQRRLGLAYLFISHDLKVVRQVADEIAIMYLGRIIEQGRPDDVLHRPLHPYTQALISAVPTPARRNRTRIVLGGDPPNPVDVPSGCPFHPRCRHAIAECRTDRLLLGGTPDGRLVACHRANPRRPGE